MTEENAQKSTGGNTKTPVGNCRERAYAFTYYPKGETGKQDITDKPKFDDNLMKWLIFSLEECPKSKRLHYQSFVYFYDKKSFKMVAKYFGNSHVEPMCAMATYLDNKNYIRGPYNKDGKEKPLNPTFEEFGDMPEQGKRTDIAKYKNEILAGKSVDEICLENPMAFHCYGRTLERVEAIALRKQFRTEMTKGIWYTGPSGSGKSHAVFSDYNPDTHYIKNLNEEWWDGYKGQPIVILNEFAGQLKYWELMDLVDKFPKMVKWRGRESVPFLAKEIRIASIRTPEMCYHNREDFSELNRRFVVHILSARTINEGHTKHPASGDLRPTHKGPIPSAAGRSVGLPLPLRGIALEFSKHGAVATKACLPAAH